MNKMREPLFRATIKISKIGKQFETHGSFINVSVIWTMNKEPIGYLRYKK